MVEKKQGIKKYRRHLRVLASGVQTDGRIVTEEGTKNAAMDTVRTRASSLGNKSTQRKDIRCWQCWNWGHDSNGCHLGKVCFLCRYPGHQKAECHLRKKSSISVGMEITSGNRGAQSPAKFRGSKYMPSKASTKHSDMGLMPERGNDVSMGGIGNGLGYTQVLEVGTVETVSGSMATKLGEERKKTYEVRKDRSIKEIKSNRMGNTLASVENESSPEKATIMEVRTIPSKTMGENKDLDEASPCNDHGVCGGAGIEVRTGEVGESTTMDVDATNLAKAGKLTGLVFDGRTDGSLTENEENHVSTKNVDFDMGLEGLFGYFEGTTKPKCEGHMVVLNEALDVPARVTQDLTDNRDHLKGGRGQDPLANVTGQGTNDVERRPSIVPVSLFDVLNEEHMINLNKILGISLPSGASCQIYRDMELDRYAG